MRIEKENKCSDKPILVGGIGNINYGKQYRQGNRVYDAQHIAMAILSQPVGNAGGIVIYIWLVNANEVRQSIKIPTDRIWKENQKAI